MNEKNKLIPAGQIFTEEAEESLDKDLSFANSYMFAKVMSEESLCIEMLQRILGVRIRKIEYIEPEKSVLSIRDAKDIRLDVYVEDEENTVYDIECQKTDTHELPKRSRYYQSQIDSALLEKGYHYSQLKKSFVIFICTFDPFKKGRHVYDFTRRCAGEEKLELKDDTHIIFLNATGRRDDCSDKLRIFLDYVDGREVEADDFIEKIEKAVAFNNQDKIWRKNVMTLAMEYKTVEIMAEKRGEKIGREQGEKIGREQGEKIGREQGEKIGQKLGRENARYSDVSSGLYSPEKGAELLNVTLEEFLKGMREAGFKLPENVNG